MAARDRQMREPHPIRSPMKRPKRADPLAGPLQFHPFHKASRLAAIVPSRGGRPLAGVAVSPAPSGGGLHRGRMRLRSRLPQMGRRCRPGLGRSSLAWCPAPFPVAKTRRVIPTSSMCPGLPVKRAGWWRPTTRRRRHAQYAAARSRDSHLLACPRSPEPRPSAYRRWMDRSWWACPRPTMPSGRWTPMAPDPAARTAATRQALTAPLAYPR